MPSSFEIKIRMSLFIKRVPDCFLAEPFQVVSTIAKKDANHTDTQSKGRRCGTWRKTIDGRTGQSWTSRHLPIHERTGSQEGSRPADRPGARRRWGWHGRKGCLSSH